MLARAWAGIREDVAAAVERDPAATSQVQMALVSPGLHAIWVHRISHAAWQVPLLRLPARLLSNVARTLTGVEIHPGATLGRRVFIDHGMGVVIGETAEVGDDVMMYHGVTLGGRSMSHGKRHPTIEAGVTLGTGARVIGPVRIGAGSQVGANAVVVKDVPPGHVAVGVPARYRTLTPADENAAGAVEDLDPAIYI
ncbi:serine O-acetyltransferase EpsC [Microlunatus sp. Y2014]|uniref:serine O-acetyltransferase EpsC n=1 Tax=Microlunatus sp. Y2014 TaxID=3418488 RepID=UPI003DA7185A